MKLAGTEWQAWTMPAGFPEQAAQLGAAGIWAFARLVECQHGFGVGCEKLYFFAD